MFRSRTDEQVLPADFSQVVEGSGDSGSFGGKDEDGMAYGEALSGKGHMTHIESIKIAKGKWPDPIRTVLDAPTLPIATGNRAESMSADSPPTSRDGVEGGADQNSCRICGAPSELGQPLFHPCKCSGTIRYIHQDWCVL
jgi:hypothetical protein